MEATRRLRYPAPLIQIVNQPKNPFFDVYAAKEEHVTLQRIGGGGVTEPPVSLGSRPLLLCPSPLPGWHAEGPVATQSGGFWAFISHHDLAKDSRRSESLFSQPLRLAKLISVEPQQAHAHAPWQNSWPSASSPAMALAKSFRCLITFAI